MWTRDDILRLPAPQPFQGGSTGSNPVGGIGAAKGTDFSLSPSRLPAGISFATMTGATA